MVNIEALAPADFLNVAGWLSSPDINQWLNSEWRGRVVDPVTISVVVRNKKNRLFLIRCDGEPCGIAGLGDVDPADKTAMVWYLLGEARFAGRGVVTEAVRQVSRFAFEEMSLESLYAWIMQDNLRSRRVLEKAGFREVGRIRLGCCSAGRQVDRVYFDLIRQDLPAPG